ncbi:MAG: c-type cytochrome [Bryobacteraceae bacterium]|nr:c-type cytochrome [Bryobacteraceae bacterium]
MVMLAAAMAASCGGVPKGPVSTRALGDAIQIEAPLGLPPVPVPDGNPPTAATIALGEKLYFSKRLSSDGTVACATCHDPERGFADGSRVSTGVAGRKGKRNAPTVLNAAYRVPLFWDGRAKSLEEQAAGPIQNELEMNQKASELEARLTADAEFRALFERAYGSPEATMERITAAIASYERTVVSGGSAFDRYLYGGDRIAMSESAVRGLEVFRNPEKGNCAKCHTIGREYALFTDNQFHNVGAGMNAEGELTDLGKEKGMFRTPTLRDVARTAPYMHDGSLKTLKEVVDFYVGGGNANPNLDKEIRPLTHLTRQERTDLVAFLESLNGVRK